MGKVRNPEGFRFMERIKAAALELLYPASANCMGCGDPLGADRGWFCSACDDRLTPFHDLNEERCPRCGRPNRWDKKCRTCGHWPEGVLSLARFVYPYRRPIERVIRQMKYAGVWALEEWIGQQIVRMLVAEAFPRTDVIVPVPMHKKRLRERGFNHSERIAKVVARELSCEIIPDALCRVRNTRQQARLSFTRRVRNLDGAFQSDKRVANLRVLLIDDVLTSGATALACAQALKAAGAVEVCMAALAGAM